MEKATLSKNNFTIKINKIKLKSQGQFVEMSKLNTISYIKFYLYIKDYKKKT